MTVFAVVFACAAAGRALAGAALAEGLAGRYEAGGSQVVLSSDGGEVVGRLAALTPGGCNLPLGSEVLRGSLLEDSLSASVRLCLVAPGCADSPGSAQALLLVSRQLVGAVQSKESCAGGVTSLTLRRVVASSAHVSSERSSARRRPRGTLALTAPSAQPAQAVQTTLIPEVPLGSIPGRPVGDSAHQPGYDPRDARSAKSLHPVDGWLARGLEELEAGRFERARLDFLQALQLDPKRAEAANGVGVTYFARGETDEALRWYKRAIVAQPSFGDAFYNMACVYAVQEKQDLALRYLRMAALRGYVELEQMDSDPDLSSLRDSGKLEEIRQLMGRRSVASSHSVTR